MSTAVASPHTAAPTWSGFIYQGHLALYHSIDCLIKGMNFTLQIDSIDDFSIIVNGQAVSTHQVKALSNNKRTTYLEALEKAACTSMLCTASTKRYLHTSVPLDDTTSHQGANGNTVEFYSYEGSDYCPLHEVEGAIKRKINSYLALSGLPSSTFLIDLKFYALHSLISSQVVYIHACCQDDLMTAADAAFTQTISSAKMGELLALSAEHEDDLIYQRYKAKLAITESIYNYTNSMASNGKKEAITRINSVYDKIKELSDESFTWLWKSLCLGSPAYSVSQNSVYDYIDIIYEIDRNPLHDGRPPYYKCKSENFYLPTSISTANPRRENIFSENLMDQIKRDPDLIDILYEFQWLIAGNSTDFSPTERFCATTGSTRAAVEDDFFDATLDRKKITKALDAIIISKDSAKAKIDD
ncbi:MAG: hypothetical protein Q8R10_05635 [Pseudomonas sp.]|uniref:ABC-three component system protein n=1 Tax=Pseudomonas sp. TaxID=306 RepID=UPI002737619D|nr:ABC-three component system protein [Pseudomonas sp.]MDP3845890.1 hypothetical protein [Pseudomonas sp.]